ncbi:MAG: hypothetical protein AABW73_02475 [Nanoarchaeota archaeon]
MTNKYFSFAKNSVITIAASVAAGAGASELASCFTDDPSKISIAATASQYVTGWATFLPLQAWDSREQYRTTKGKFDKKRFLLDNLKFGIALTGLDVAYIIGRPFLQNNFLNNRLNAAESSLRTDYILVPAYTIAAIAAAKITGILKTKRENESILEEEVKK